VRTLYRWLARLDLTGSVVAAPASGGAPRLLNKADELLLILYLCERLCCHDPA
jgi:transposase